MSVNYTKLLVQVIAYSLGLMLVIEGIFLNIVAIISNDATFMIQGAVLVFLGAIGLSISRYVLALSKNSEEKVIRG